jgi:3-carboxy-cis,cis-muconate cycloisomerase
VAWHATRARTVEIGTFLASLIGALAKMAGDVAHLVSTEVGEVSEPFIPGRGGSTAMPHKRNPVACTVILAAHAAAKGPVTTLLDGMAAAHERPAGAWHGEWHALPVLFGLASGALLFADAVAARLAPELGREEAHRLVEHAATEVRESGRSLHDVLGGQGRSVEAAFDLAPAIAASALWADRARAYAAEVRSTLRE